MKSAPWIGHFVVQHYPAFFGNLHIELKNMKSIVMEAIRKEPRHLMHASELLRDDEEVVQLATQQLPSAMMFASRRIQQLRVRHPNESIVNSKLNASYILE